MAPRYSHPRGAMTTAVDHQARPGGLSVERTTALTRRVTRLSLAMALVLTGVKLAAWIASGSIALLASLADSGLDILAAAATFLAVRYAAAPPDREHRYGHGKAEAFASLLQAGLVFASAALVGQEAIRHLISPQPLRAEGWALAVMAASTLLTVLLVRAQGRVLAQARSASGSSWSISWLELSRNTWTAPQTSQPATMRPAKASIRGELSARARPTPAKAVTFAATSTR